MIKVDGTRARSLLYHSHLPIHYERRASPGGATIPIVWDGALYISIISVLLSCGSTQKKGQIIMMENQQGKAAGHKAEPEWSWRRRRKGKGAPMLLVGSQEQAVDLM